MALYSDIVMDHFMHPRNVGEIENPDGVGQVGNAKCGDIMKMYLKIRDNVIQDVKFETFGCAAAIATSSMVTELAKGRTLQNALKITNKEVADELGGLPPAKLHCSLLAQEGIQAAAADYYMRRDGKLPEGLTVPKTCIACGCEAEEEEEERFVSEHDRVAE